MQAIVRAIDVGFGNTKYVTAVDAGIVKCAHFPSATTLASEEFDAMDPLGLKRKTVAVAVDGLKYEVGPDIHLATNLFQGYRMYDGFWKTQSTWRCYERHYSLCASTTFGNRGRHDVLASNADSTRRVQNTQYKDYNHIDRV